MDNFYILKSKKTMKPEVYRSSQERKKQRVQDNAKKARIGSKLEITEIQESSGAKLTMQQKLNIGMLKSTAQATEDVANKLKEAASKTSDKKQREQAIKESIELKSKVQTMKNNVVQEANLIDQDEINLLFARQQDSSSSMYLQVRLSNRQTMVLISMLRQLFLLLFFFVYVTLETSNMLQLKGVVKVIDTYIEEAARIRLHSLNPQHYENVDIDNVPHNQLDDMIYDLESLYNFIKIQPHMYNDDEFERVVPNYLMIETENSFFQLLDHQAADEAELEEKTFMMDIEPDHQAKHAKFLSDNTYFMGMRVSTINASIMFSDDFLTMEVNEYIRSTEHHRADAIDEEHLNATDYRDNIWQTDNGKFGQGFVWYLNGNMSKSEATIECDKFAESGFLDNEMLMTSVEFMFYDNNDDLGVIYTYFFYRSNSGRIQIQKDVAVFLPNQYSDHIDPFKVTAIVCATILLLIVTFQILMNTRLKFRALVTNKINQFYSTDILTFLQVISGIAFVCYGIYLFSSKVSDDDFRVVLGSQKDFDRWVKWSEHFENYRMLLGIYSIIQVLNFLMISSNNLPSLGILFETILRSRSDMIMFTLIFQLMFLCLAVMCNMLFGSRLKIFSRLNGTYLTLLQMMFGEYDYSGMYQANSGVAAIVFLSFIYVFYFLVMYMYVAIVTRTYNKLRAQKLFLSEAMARIIMTGFKTTFMNFFNLIFFRDSTTLKNPTESSAFDLNSDSDSDRAYQQQQGTLPRREQVKLTLPQKFSRNLAICIQSWNQIITKQDFIDQLKMASADILFEREQAKVKRLNKLRGEHSEESYKILKNGVKYLFFIVITCVFFFTAQESQYKNDINKPIYDYLFNTEFTREFSSGNNTYKLGDIDYGYRGFVSHYLTQIELDTIGFNKLQGDDYMRITYRFFDEQINDFYGTAVVFPSRTKISYLESEISELQTPFDQRLQMELQKMRIYDEIELSQNITLQQNNGIVNQIRYMQPYPNGNYEDSLYGSGGFVFLFDRETKTDRTTGISLEEIARYDWTREHRLASVGLDWVMYNPNYNLDVYCALEFQYSSNGAFKLLYKTEMFNGTQLRNRIWYAILSIMYGLFVIYYCIKTSHILFVIWRKMNKAKEDKKRVLDPYFFEYERQQRKRMPWFHKALIFCNVDRDKLKDQNCVVIIVLTIGMMIKGIINNLLKLMTVIVSYCKQSIFSFLEFVILYMHLQINYSLYQQGHLLDAYVTAKADVEEGQYVNLISNLNNIARYFGSIEYQMALSIMLSLFRSLELLQFSMELNLPVATMRAGLNDIVNWIVIWSFFLCGYAIAGYMVFCTSMAEFQTVQTTLFTLVIMTTGEFAVIEKMQEKQPVFTPIYFLSFMVITIVFLASIFIGLIGSHFNREITLLEKEVSDSDQNVFLTDVIYQIVSKYYILKKETANTKGKSITFCRGICKTPLWVLRLIDKWLDPNKQVVLNAFNDTPLVFEEEKAEGPNQNLEFLSQMFQKKLVQAVAEPEIDEKEYVVNESEEAEMHNNSYVWQADPERLKPSPGMKMYLNYYSELKDGEHSTDDLNKETRTLLEAASANVSGREVEIIRKIGMKHEENLLSLKQEWNEQNASRNEFSNTHFWIHHLEEHISMLLKKQMGLYDFKNSDTFFSQMLIAKDSTKFNYFQQRMLKKSKEEQLKFFSNSLVTTREKYQVWFAIDIERKKETTQARADDDVIQFVGKSEGTLNELDFSEDFERDGRLFNFRSFQGSQWRRPDMHLVDDLLLEVWRNHLTNKEKYFLWFKHFTSGDRVRLWNKLVFAREWFRRIIVFSKQQVGAISQLPTRNRKKELEDDNMIRHDIYMMLKTLSKRMYNEGVIDEELLLQKFHTLGKFKKNSKTQLTLPQQRAIRNEIYTCQEMRKLWEQLFMHEPGLGYHKQILIKEKLDHAAQIKKPLKNKGDNADASFMSAGDTKDFNQALDRQPTKYGVGQAMGLSQQNQVDQSVNMSMFEGGQKDKGKGNNDDIVFQGSSSSSARQSRDDDSDSSGEKAFGDIDATAIEDDEAGKDYDFLEEKERSLDKFEQVVQFFKLMVQHNAKVLNESKERTSLKHRTRIQTTQTNANMKLKAASHQKLIKLEGEEIVNDLFVSRRIARTSVAAESIKEKKNRQRYEKEEEEQKQDVLDYQDTNESRVFEDICNNVNKEEERLPMWICMTIEQKLDLLAHQIVEPEAQMIAFLIEQEFGAEMNLMHCNSELYVDSLLEKGLRHQLFVKYLAISRLQATIHARKATEENIKEAQKKDQELIDYSSFLKNQAQLADERIKHYQFLVDEKKSQTKNAKAKLEEIGFATLKARVDPEKSARIMQNHSHEEIQLAQAYYKYSITPRN